ncbi:protein EFR3 [Marchantia polymorpha subsp. ruderalis]|uniref:Short rhizoids 4 n=1 Tax=Marchantia polymorpha TaxID=3197 RepID=A0A1L7B575_MARPO|nr:short rhizoids 4 [Marchantia polymorpha]
MGIISRRILPACGMVCICCPELRARSRQPVKRYKKLMADIFPKSQDELPNDRKIGKLTEYASKNPLRIPKIADGLEQRGYKELRGEHYGTVRVVMRTYSKLLSACRDQMPLFATSCLSMIKALLDQVRHDQMRVLGCQTLVDFLQNQMDSTYLRNLDAFLPKLCAMSRETGDESKRDHLRAAGLHALSAMISFMGKYSHISAEFEDIVAVVLDNYDADIADLEQELQERAEPHDDSNWVKVLKGEGRGAVSAMTRAISKLYSHKDNARAKDPTTLTSTESEQPKVWSQICVQNLAKLAKEATTVRRIMEPMFQYFDGGSHWSPEQGLALPVLREMQFNMIKSGNEKLFLPVLVRHLDHKSVVDQPALKTNIVEVIGTLARQSKAKATVSDVGSMSDLLKHLRKSILFTRDATHFTHRHMMEEHKALQMALEDSLTEFAKRVGDAGPVLDMMAANLEKLSNSPSVARSAIEAVSVLARCVSFIPDQSYTEQLFPEALFQQLLQAMIHSDVETRLRAHHILAVLLAVPSHNIATTRADDQDALQTVPEVTTMLARTSSVFSSAAALFEKLRSDKYGFSTSFRDREIQPESGYDDVSREGAELKKMSSIRNGEDTSNNPFASPNRLFGFRMSLDRTTETPMDRSPSRQPRRSTKSFKDVEMTVVRLSGHQAALLLSTLWLQATLPDNLPSNFEAIAHTYMLVLLFSRAKTSSHSTILRAFQLAFSIRNLAHDSENNQLPPSRRRSLFMLATAMLVFAGRAYNIPQVMVSAKATLTSTVKDPFLDLVDDNRLKVVAASSVNLKDYGSATDDHEALRSLSCISFAHNQTSEALVALIVHSGAPISDSEGSSADQMLQPFCADDVQGLVPHLYLEAPHKSGFGSGESTSFEEILARTSASYEDELLNEGGGDLLRLPAWAPTPAHVQHAIGVTALLEAALQTAGQVACVQIPDSPLSYSAMASQCEAFGVGSRRKMSSVLRLDPECSSMRLTLPDKDWPALISFNDDQPQAHGPEDTSVDHNPDVFDTQSAPLIKQDSLNSVSFSPSWLTPAPPEPWQVFRLPPASPYDNFLKAACC